MNQSELKAKLLERVYNELSQALLNKQIKSYEIVTNNEDIDLQYYFVPVDPIKRMSAFYEVDTKCLENG